MNSREFEGIRCTIGRNRSVGRNAGGPGSGIGRSGIGKSGARVVGSSGGREVGVSEVGVSVGRMVRFGEPEFCPRSWGPTGRGRSGIWRAGPLPRPGSCPRFATRAAGAAVFFGAEAWFPSGRQCSTRYKRAQGKQRDRWARQKEGGRTAGVQLRPAGGVRWMLNPLRASNLVPASLVPDARSSSVPPFPPDRPHSGDRASPER